MQSLFRGTIVHSRETRGITESVAILLVTGAALLAAGIAWSEISGLDGGDGDRQPGARGCGCGCARRRLRESTARCARGGGGQALLDRHGLEPHPLHQVVRSGHPVREVPVTGRYHSRGTAKTKPLRGGWRILRPLVFLRFGLRS